MRQIRSGLFCFFYWDPVGVFPLDTEEEAERMISAMGGIEQVRRLCAEALEGSENDLRWAISLAGRLTNHSQASEDDLTLLADALRKVGQRTTSSNLRNWCLTRALTLEGRIDGARLNNHRFSRRQIEGWSVETAVSVLRVLIDPATLTGIDIHLTVELDGERTGLHFRNHIACPTDGEGGDTILIATRAIWDQMLTGALDLQSALNNGDVSLEGDKITAIEALKAIDHPAFR